MLPDEVVARGGHLYAEQSHTSEAIHLNSMALLVLREDIGNLVLNHTFQVISGNEWKIKGCRKLIGFKEFLLKKNPSHC